MTVSDEAAALFERARAAADSSLRRINAPGLLRALASPWAARGQMTVADARRAFGNPLVRVSLDWQKLEKLHAPVVAHVYTDKSDLGLLVHPWYADAGGNETGWDFPEARPVTVAEVAAKPTHGTTAARREGVAAIAAEMRAWSPPIQVTAFGYELPDGKQLILDSNHRIAALATLAEEGTPFRLIVLGVKGPLDGSILPDLLHHGLDRKPLAKVVAQAERRRAAERTIPDPLAI